MKNAKSDERNEKSGANEKEKPKISKPQTMKKRSKRKS